MVPTRCLVRLCGLVGVLLGFVTVWIVMLAELAGELGEDR